MPTATVERDETTDALGPSDSHDSGKKRLGILLINTGSASAPEPKAVKTYLRQFLSDPRIIDFAAWKRKLLVELILLLRPKKTAEAYEAIWTERGSPLIAISEDLRDALRPRFPEAQIEIAMAYGTPSIPSQMDALVEREVEQILLVPMFPQYASATTGSVLACAYDHAAKQWNLPMLSVVPPYFDDPHYIEAWEAVARPVLDAFHPDHVLMSFHGLPVRHVKKSDTSGQHCQCVENCCEQHVSANRMCYGRHCVTSAKLVAQRLGLHEGDYTITYQSRLGRDPWLEPATDTTIENLAKRGIKRLAVLSPAFTADCLETLEEIGIGGKETFLEHGGEAYILVPSLNTNAVWVDAIAGIIARQIPATMRTAAAPPA